MEREREGKEEREEGKEKKKKKIILSTFLQAHYPPSCIPTLSPLSLPSSSFSSFPHLSSQLTKELRPSYGSVKKIFRLPASRDAQLALPAVEVDEVLEGDVLVACGGEPLARIVYGTQTVSTKERGEREREEEIKRDRENESRWERMALLYIISRFIFFKAAAKIQSLHLKFAF